MNKIISKKPNLLLLLVVSLFIYILWTANNLYASNIKKQNNKLLVLTKDIILNKEYKNRIVYLEAIVLQTYINKNYEIKYIYLKTDLPKQIQVIIWPSLGITDDFLPGDKISIIGIAKPYKDKLQITPLSKSSINKLHTNYCKDYIAPHDIEKHMNEFVIIKGLKGISAKEITSRKSKKKHLLFTVSGDGFIFKGIMFSGNWTTKDLDLLSSGKELCMYAKISKYKGEISLQANRITEVAK